MIGDAIKITVITVLENKAVLKIGSETKTVEQGKEIPIAEDITLMLTSICENKVRLGITAPNKYPSAAAKSTTPSNAKKHKPK